MKRKKIVVITGVTNSGKSSVADMLCDKKKYTRIPTYTTRVISKSEAKDFCSVSKEEFARMEENGEFAECAEYTTPTGTYKCGTRIKDYDVYKGVAVIDYKGIPLLHKSPIRKDISIVRLTAPSDTLRMRGILKGENSSELERRIAAETVEYDKLADYANATIDESIAYNTASVVALITEIVEYENIFKPAIPVDAANAS